MIHSETIDLLITGGRVFDPGQNLDTVTDVAVSDGLVAQIGPGIDPRRADNVVDASGALVVPGLIDLHTHVAGPLRKIGDDDLYLEPDIAGVLGGATTVVDAGSVGAYNLGGFARFVAPACATRSHLLSPCRHARNLPRTGDRKSGRYRCRSRYRGSSR